MLDIPDGYTRQMLIPETDRHSAVRIAYRPMLAAERQRLALETVRLAERGYAGRVAAGKLVAGAIASRLASWDVVDDSAGGGTQGRPPVQPAAGSGDPRRTRSRMPTEISSASLVSLAPALFEKIATAVTAFDDEGASARNLRDGVRLLLTAPAVAWRSCEHCQRYVYDEASGRPYENPPRSGRLVVRPNGTHPPCRIAGVGCPKGTPENQRALSAANRAAWRHYRECRATGLFPDDPLVRRNAAIIRDVEDAIERRRWDAFRNSVLVVLSARR
jgi:hypothetical protein